MPGAKMSLITMKKLEVLWIITTTKKKVTNDWFLFNSRVDWKYISVYLTYRDDYNHIPRVIIIKGNWLK